jgi:glycosyltransferase involved in cell wall biosynthesis
MLRTLFKSASQPLRQERSPIKPRKLLVLCPHPENVAPGQRLKYEQYFDYFRENGYTVTLAPFMTRPFWNIVYRKGHYLQKIFWTLYGYLRRIVDLLRLPFYDGVYIFLWVVPFGPAVFETLACWLNRRVIYDIDDLVFLKPKSKANPFVAIWKSESRITHLMRKAKHIITCTPTLDTFARRFNPNTTDISSTINTDVYVPANRYVNDGPLTLGWSGSHSTIKYLYLLKDILLDLNREIPIKLLVIGDKEFHLEGPNVTALPWVEHSEVADLQRIDIGLYPLPDEPWILGKSGLKALQYMALGIPTVATALGANFRIIEDGLSGFLVRTDEEWKARLHQLICDPELRRRMGARARERVEQFYSVRANRDTYLKILNAVVEGRSGRGSE